MSYLKVITPVWPDTSADWWVCMFSLHVGVKHDYPEVCLLSFSFSAPVQCDCFLYVYAWLYYISIFSAPGMPYYSMFTHDLVVFMCPQCLLMPLLYFSLFSTWYAWFPNVYSWLCCVSLFSAPGNAWFCNVYSWLCCVSLFSAPDMLDSLMFTHDFVVFLSFWHLAGVSDFSMFTHDIAWFPQVYSWLCYISVFAAPVVPDSPMSRLYCNEPRGSPSLVRGWHPWYPDAVVATIRRVVLYQPQYQVLSVRQVPCSKNPSLHGPLPSTWRQSRPFWYQKWVLFFLSFLLLLSRSDILHCRLI